MQSVATEFTPWASLVGGMLIGLSAVMVMLLFGRIAGISGITVQVMRPFAARRPDDWRWRAAFILGLLVAPLLVGLFTGGVQQTVTGALGAMALAGVLVGFGTAFGSGCTSGHGVCGLARLSKRSLAAVAIFMGVAFATVFVLRHVIGGA
jgi:uncharacterized membrane protein YedE/YeeE